MSGYATDISLPKFALDAVKEATESFVEPLMRVASWFRALSSSGHQGRVEVASSSSPEELLKSCKLVESALQEMYFRICAQADELETSLKLQTHTSELLRQATQKNIELLNAASKIQSHVSPTNEATVAGHIQSKRSLKELLEARHAKDLPVFTGDPAATLGALGNLFNDGDLLVWSRQSQAASKDGEAVAHAHSIDILSHGYSLGYPRFSRQIVPSALLAFIQEHRVRVSIFLLGGSVFTGHLIRFDHSSIFLEQGGSVQPISTLKILAIYKRREENISTSSIMALDFEIGSLELGTAETSTTPPLKKDIK